MKRLFLTTVAATAITATSVAVAADLPMATRMPPPGLAPPPIFSWTGCYLGASVGIGTSHTQWQDTQAVGDLDFTGTFRQPHTDGSGAAAGGQVGCDWQVSPTWVLGLQGTFHGADINSTQQDQFNAQWTLRNDINWFATFTGRVGWAMNNVMIYGKGGAAWAQSKLEVENSGVTIFNGSTTRTGWTIGTGLEWGFAPNWSAFGELNYYSFGNTSTGPFLAVADTAPEPFNTKMQFETFMVGVNYRFRAW